MRQGAAALAAPLLGRALAHCRAGNFSTLTAWTAALLGYAHALSGRPTDALDLLQEASTRAAALRVRVNESMVIGGLAEAYLLVGRREEASDLAKSALDIARERQERGTEGWLLRLQGEIASSAPAPDAATAQAWFTAAAGLAEVLGMRPLLAQCQLGIGRLHWKIGRMDEARHELAEAIELFRSMDMMTWGNLAEEALHRCE